MGNETNLFLAVSGLVIGLLTGIVIQRSRFCMTAVVSNWVLMRDARQLHTYLMAICVAIIGTLILEYTGLVAIGETSYRDMNINWLGVMVGGLLFGLGAILAGGCIGRIIVLTGEGSLSGLLALLAIALGATVTYTGLLAPVRLWLQSASFDLTSGDASIITITHAPVWIPLLITTGILVRVMAKSYAASAGVRLIWAGLAIGLLVVVGWWVTGYLGVDDFSPHKPVSLTFSGPLARISLYLTVGNEPERFFGILLVAGVLLGAFLSAVHLRSFRIMHPAPASITRILSGGLMMGVGAVMAGGCNIGQGLTGLSTLSVESMLAVAAIFSGMYLGLAWLQYAESRGSLWAFLHLHHGLPGVVAR